MYSARRALHHPHPRAFCTLSSFARIKRPRWQPVELNDRRLRCHGKIGDSEQSTKEKIFVVSALTAVLRTFVLQKRKIEPRANIERFLASVRSQLVNLSPRCFRTCATAENSLIGVFSSSLIAKQNYPKKKCANRHLSEKKSLP